MFQGADITLLCLVGAVLFNRPDLLSECNSYRA